jgi:hypothetical protein
MMPSKVISPEFLVWSQLLLVWSFAAYGVAADPLNGETGRVHGRRWKLILSFRVLLATVLAYLFSRSIVLSIVLLLMTLFQPLLRYRLPMRWLAEFEGLWISAYMASSLALVRHFQLDPQWLLASILPSQLAALCILASTLFLVVRGGTYIVRGVLRKSGALPSRQGSNMARGSSHVRREAGASESGTSIAASVEHPAQSIVDVEEYNRGRLIGNLERIVLTIVIAGGSYAALAFLVAAKGVVRSGEFQNDRDFAEYFLIGSLSSVLVALSAGLALRFALIRLWPDLLSLRMQ